MLIMPRSAVRIRPLVLALLGCMAAACSDEAAPNGGLLVIVESDLSVAKDIDEARVEVRRGSDVLFTKRQTIGPSGLALPAEFRVSGTRDKAPVTVQATVLKHGEMRVQRSAITPIDADHYRVLPLYLSYLCKGFVDSMGRSSCAEGQTCKLGVCVDAAIPGPLPLEVAAPEPAQDPDTAMSGVLGDNANDTCFDVLSCFADASTLDLQVSGCSFALPPDADSNKFNLALELPLGADGICDLERCWIPLDQGEDGWTVNDGQVQLPPVLCADQPDSASRSVAVSMACATKTTDTPACEPWASHSSSIHAQGEALYSAGAVAGSCAGFTGNGCEMCGWRKRKCVDGTYTSWGECMDRGECSPGETRACGTGGTQSCGEGCSWGECLGQTCGDGQRIQPCGHCGTQARSCDNGTWSAWGQCLEEGECAQGELATCEGGGSRVCGANCHWGECTRHRCEGQAEEPCPPCGVRTRTCDEATGNWSEWSECTQQGCAPNSTRACGNQQSGTQVCRGDCQWDADCSGQRCDGPLTRACPDGCGVQTRQCDPNTGREGPWSECVGQGVCKVGEERACDGGTGLQTCGGECRWQDCVPICDGPFRRKCGLCGTGVETRGCDRAARTETSWSACTDPAMCLPGAHGACGSGGSRTCGDDCRWPAACDCPPPGEALTRDCPMCGMQVRTCTGPVLSDWSVCMGQGECEKGAQQACDGGGSQSCADTCRWGACVCKPPLISCPGQCTDTASDAKNCGACGNACGKGMSCRKSECVCDAPNRKCGADCIDPDKTCTVCDPACTHGKTCANGECVCKPPDKICGTECVDSDTICTECDPMCGAGMTCMNGDCVCNAPTERCGDTCIGPDESCPTCPPACKNGFSCVEGTCSCPATSKMCGSQCIGEKDPCTDCMPACPAGLTCVNGACDCAADSKKCGSGCIGRSEVCKECMLACGAGLTCINGECICAPPTKPCRGGCIGATETCESPCMPACNEGMSCVNNECVCPAGRKKCGSGCIADTATCEPPCMPACNEGMSCVNNECVCSAGRKKCGPGCIADTATCDVCDPACAEGVSCVDGKCGCPEKMKKCGPGCIADTAACDVCDPACAEGVSCVDGKCGCPEKMKKCGAGCIADTAACDACDPACAEGVSCVDGKCGCPEKMKKCGPGCIADTATCDVCDPACAEGVSCVDGKCACPEGSQNCHGSCIAKDATCLG